MIPKLVELGLNLKFALGLQLGVALVLGLLANDDTENVVNLELVGLGALDCDEGNSFQFWIEGLLV